MVSEFSKAKKNRNNVYEKTILNPLALKTGDLMYIDNFDDQCLARCHMVSNPLPMVF